MNSAKAAGQPTDCPSADPSLDPLTEATALRAALAEVVWRIGRLIVSLRHWHRQRRARQAAWTNLQHLRLGPKEKP